jgi:hypothetical protein
MRKFIFASLALIAASFGLAHADYVAMEEGKWPEHWPMQFDAFRKQARTLEGGELNAVFYELPLTKREDFESLWPHVLKTRGERVPLVLLRSPDSTFGKKVAAGIRIKCRPRQMEGKVAVSTKGAATKSQQLPDSDILEIQLINDGTIVDLNRIPLPPDSRIADRRFGND